MYVSLQEDQKLTQLWEYDPCMIEKSLYCTTFAFCLHLSGWKKKIALIARKKINANFNVC